MTTASLTPTGPELKKLLARFNKQLAAKGHAEISYSLIEADIRSTNNACSKSTVAQILNGKYDGGTGVHYCKLIYNSLLRFGMPPAEEQKPAPVKVDVLGFITINHRDYYVGGIRSGTVVTFEPGAEPNSIRLLTPFKTGDLRPLDKSTTQLEATNTSTGKRRTGGSQDFVSVGKWHEPQFRIGRPARTSRPSSVQKG